MSGLGPSFMKIWTCRSSLRSESRNAWTRIKNVNGASRLSNFWNFFGAIKWFLVGRDWWPWTKPGYITMTRRQSDNQWCGGIAAHPAPTQKIPSAEIPWKILASIFWEVQAIQFAVPLFDSCQLQQSRVSPRTSRLPPADLSGGNPSPETGRLYPFDAAQQCTECAARCPPPHDG